MTKHRLHRLRCPQCAKETQAELTTDVPRGAFGPPPAGSRRHPCGAQPESPAATPPQLLRELFGAELSTGSVDAIIRRMFGVWTTYRQDGDRSRLLEQIGPLKEELRALLAQAARKSAKTKHHRIFATNLLKRWPALWTFTTVPGVEPTNNHAERGLRGAVIHRRLSLGSRSEGGVNRTIERLLSASVACRLQRRSLFVYLTDVLSAGIRGDPISLLL